MNIVELHLKANFFMDSEKSPRFKKLQVDKAINSAISDIVLDRYDNIRKDKKEYNFQSSQRLRDELYTIVKRDNTVSISDDFVKVLTVTDYWLLLSLKASISGSWIDATPITYDERNIIEQDPFTRPSLTYPERIYRIESSEGVEIVYGDTGVLIAADMYYIQKPVKVNIGTEVSMPGTAIAGGTSVISYIDGTVLTQDGSGDTVTLNEGEKITLKPANDWTLTSGIVFKDFVETDIPEMLHEEIARKAASILSGNVENYNRWKTLNEDIKNTER